MLRLEIRTRLSPEKAIAEAVAFFGPGGYGLEVRENDKDHAYFVGGGGSVAIAATSQDKNTSVELISQEWDFQVREFTEKIG